VSADAPLLSVEDLRVSFRTEDGVVQAVDGVSFTVNPGEVVAIVGESGSGKSVTSMTLMGLTRSPNASFEGTAHFEGAELVGASNDQLRRIRGARIAMIFQDPMSSLDPVYRIGRQIAEQILVHDTKISQGRGDGPRGRADGARRHPRARDRARSYPHEFSGGMRQRVMIAMALSCSPSLLIADEPTTALDVTIQAQILDELRLLREQSGTGIILVTHDLGVVADIADRVVVMYAGRSSSRARSTTSSTTPSTPTPGACSARSHASTATARRHLPAIAGLPPSLMNPPAGCHFRPRCPHAFAQCIEVPGAVAPSPERARRTSTAAG
jgi:peptide/nickel transport system ATP-binding protein